MGPRLFDVSPLVVWDPTNPQTLVFLPRKKSQWMVELIRRTLIKMPSGPKEFP